MLTNEDIEFMKQTRKEVVKNRRHDITIYWEIDGEKDPWTGEPLEPTTDDKVVKSVVTEITAINKGANRLIINGIEVEEGDIQFSISIEDIVSIPYFMRVDFADDEYDIFGDVKNITYDEREYTVLAQSKKGIGERNRVEFLGRRTI
ncbi:hypothetical protein JOC34_002819 [Virgibacillus halotolerans]|uniref:hypothetical protein n=1 Tax=Virgibacillus halotolerans TaxID=1071053 RepID=UPI001961EF7E|nr:hypothetical protein [Virgibacillus halotolerans]MBM7600428.1 hypothetical protein [Virgibacillus halotolerans]